MSRSPQNRYRTAEKSTNWTIELRGPAVVKHVLLLARRDLESVAGVMMSSYGGCKWVGILLNGFIA
jgi:hypothetical protein